jgi:predicted nuclease with TOPRIM domain
MDDSSSNSKWLWILGAGALVIAIVGVVLAISAKNSAVDSDQVVNEATGQIKEELSGLNGAVKASEEIQDEHQAQAARDRARIKREVKAAVKGGENSLGKLNAEVKELQAEAGDSTQSFESLEKEVDTLTSEQEDLQTQVNHLKERLNKSGV